MLSDPSATQSSQENSVPVRSETRERNRSSIDGSGSPERSRLTARECEFHIHVQTLNQRGGVSAAPACSLSKMYVPGTVYSYTSVGTSRCCVGSAAAGLQGRNGSCEGLGLAVWGQKSDLPGSGVLVAFSASEAAGCSRRPNCKSVRGRRKQANRPQVLQRRLLRVSEPRCPQ